MSTYTLAPSLLTKGEIALEIPLLDAQGYETRGATLARSMRGRWAREVRCFYLTPGRAKKWETLYRAGFSARQSRLVCDYVWRFVLPGITSPHGVPLNDAMKIAQAALAPRTAELEFA